MRNDSLYYLRKTAVRAPARPRLTPSLTAHGACVRCIRPLAVVASQRAGP